MANDERPEWAAMLKPTDTLQDLIRKAPGQTAEGLWEEYEEAFADDPFSFFYNELARLTAHVLGLKHQLTAEEEGTIMRLWTWANVDLPGEYVLLDYEPMAKHYDEASESQFLERLRGMEETLKSFHRSIVDAMVEQAETAAGWDPTP